MGWGGVEGMDSLLLFKWGLYGHLLRIVVTDVKDPSKL